MKQLRFGLMLFLVVLASGSTMAMGSIKFEIVPGKKEKAVVDVLSSPNIQFEAELKDANGSVIFTDKEVAPTYNYKKIYDFSNLENGKYTFEIKSGNVSEFKDLMVTNGNIHVITQEDQIDPDFVLNGKFLEFSFPNLTDHDARLLLYNNDTRQWVYQENICPEYDIRQSLNLSKLHTGNYKAVLISGSDVFDFNFKLG